MAWPAAIAIAWIAGEAGSRWLFLPRISGYGIADDSRSGSQSSFGLGLAIVKSIMTLHGGSVRVESIPNGMTTFTLAFPRV